VLVVDVLFEARHPVAPQGCARRARHALSHRAERADDLGQPSQAVPLASGARPVVQKGIDGGRERGRRFRVQQDAQGWHSQHERPHALRLRQREVCGHLRTVIDCDEGRALDAQPVEQGRQIMGMEIGAGSPTRLP
jgi:hypothetical protein